MEVLARGITRCWETMWLLEGSELSSACECGASVASGAAASAPLATRPQRSHPIGRASALGQKWALPARTGAPPVDADHNEQVWQAARPSDDDAGNLVSRGCLRIVTRSSKCNGSVFENLVPERSN